MGEEDVANTTDQDWAAAFEEVNKTKQESNDTNLDWDAAFAEVKEAEKKDKQDGAVPAVPGPSPFDEFGEVRPGRISDRGLDFLLDIPLEISVELGRTRIPIGDLLKMGQGSIVELNRLAGEPVDVYVNGKMLGKGEVVVADEKFGVRLTEIINRADRIKNLG